MSFSPQLIACTALLAAGNAAAAMPSAPPDSSLARSARQLRVAGCNRMAVGTHGNERRLFLRKCLKTDAATAPLPEPLGRLTTCHADARIHALEGDRFRDFMIDCVSIATGA